jgi:hypothetical protein
MSLTFELKKKGQFYDLVLSHIDLNKAQTLIKDHQQKLNHMYYPAPEGTQFPLVGMAVIYAVREHLAKQLGERWWNQTVAGSVAAYPNIEGPAKYVYMALADKQARTSTKFYAKQAYFKCLVSDYGPSIEDVTNILTGFSVALPPALHPFIPNPAWGPGADANLLMGHTLWDIRTTQSKAPLTIENIIQQVAYCLINKGAYQIDSLAVYYSRQQCYFEYPLTRLLKPSALKQLQQSSRPLINL